MPRRTSSRSSQAGSGSSWTLVADADQELATGTGPELGDHIGDGRIGEVDPADDSPNERHRLRGRDEFSRLIKA
jgi:hypothetical protein